MRPPRSSANRAEINIASSEPPQPLERAISLDLCCRQFLYKNIMYGARQLPKKIMKANKTFLVLLACLLLSTLSGCSQNPNDYILNRWRVPLPFTVSNDNIERRDLYWGYIVVKLTDSDMEKLEKIDMSKYSCGEWKNADSNLILGDLNIDKKSLRCSIFKNSEKCQFKGIFLDKTRKRVIFADYNWSGY